MSTPGASRGWRVSDQQLTHAWSAAESILHDAADATQAVVLAATDIARSVLKQQDRERHQPTGATAKIISMLPEHHFDCLLMDKLESVELRQEWQGKELTPDDLLARYVKFTIRDARNTNPFRAAVNWCLVLCGDFTAEQTLSLLDQVAPEYVAQQFPEQECSRLRHKMLGGIRWRFARMLPQEHGTLVVNFKRPSAHELEVINQCLQQFLPWGVDHVIPPGYKAGDPLSFSAHKAMKAMHLFSCPLCFSRLSCAWNFGAFEDHVRIPSLNRPQLPIGSFNPPQSPTGGIKLLEEIRKSIMGKRGGY